MARPVECIDCIGEGSTRWRQIHSSSGPRSPRCATHTRALRKSRNAAAHAARVLRVYGLPADEHVALWTFQGEHCPCGRQPTRQPDTDHDHRLARTHPHPDEHACSRCLRGLLCRSCNTYVVGRYSAAALRALADYIEHPPWPAMLAQRKGSAS